jgi:hypothetical protein
MIRIWVRQKFVTKSNWSLEATAMFLIAWVRQKLYHSLLHLSIGVCPYVVFLHLQFFAGFWLYNLFIPTNYRGLQNG